MPKEKVPIVSVRQIKAGRALLGWTQEDLTLASGISLGTLKRLEAVDGLGPIGGRPATIAAIISALVAAGVSFDMADGAGPGVRLRE